MNRFLYFAAVLALCGCVSKAEYLKSEGARDSAVKDQERCRASEKTMAENRTKDFQAFAFKSDTQLKEQIFQQGLLCGGMYALHVIPDLPKDYSQFFEVCQKGADSIKSDPIAHK